MLRADLYDLAGNRTGEGPLTNIVSASVTRVLDGIGAVSINVPLNDERAIRLLQNERRIRLFWQMQNVVREVGRGIVRDIRIQPREAHSMLVASGPDEMDELNRANTWLARIYSGQTVDAVAASLASLASGWSAESNNTALINARYDGASAFKALLELAAQQGSHIRLGNASKTVEFGVFGTPAALRITNVRTLHRDLYRADDIAIISSLEIVQSSEAVANRIMPLGQGEGEAALTLARSTRASPYTIQTMVIGGKTQYYLEDTDSIAAYGGIEKTLVYRQIGAVSNTDGDLEIAANALYDVAAYDLQRKAVRLDTYRCTVRKLNKLLRPGDKVRLTYDGTVMRGSKPYRPTYIDSDFWVMRVTEKFTVSGHVVDLELASVDRVKQDAVELLVGKIEEVEINNLRVQTQMTMSPYVFDRTLDDTHPAVIPVEFTNATTELLRARVRLVTRPFRSTAKAASGGGGSLATTSSGGGATPTSSNGGGTTVSSTIAGGGYGFANTGVNSAAGDPHVHSFFLIDHQHSVTIGSHTHTVTVPSHDHTVNIAAHAHAIEYGIEDDTERPNTVSLWIDGIDRTAALGGPWGVGGVAVNTVLDITSFLINAGLRQRHELELRCASGQGEVELTVELYQVIQPIAV